VHTSEAKTLYSYLKTDECYSGLVIGRLVVNDYSGNVESFTWSCWDGRL